MEAFQRSCSDAQAYPNNLIEPGVPGLVLESTRQEFRRLAPRLFCDEERASIDILELQNSDEESRFKCVRSSDDLRKRLEASMIHARREPMNRFFFISAPSSRDKLNITQQMAVQIFSHHQVMPSFVECLSAFGFQEHSQDCTLTAFQSQNCLVGSNLGIEIPQLGRSGLDMEHCYALRSVERSKAQPEWPWAIRQCSTYHSLDLGSGQAAWIFVKANKLIERLVRETVDQDGYREKLEPDNVRQSLIAALQIHEILAEWSCSNWQWYISFLESMLQDVTRATLSVRMEPETVPITEPTTELLRTSSPTRMSFDSDHLDEKPKALRRARTSFRTYTQRLRSFTYKRKARDFAEEQHQVSHHRFSFKDLPRVHYIEDRTNEVYDILCSNNDVLEDLKSEYKHVMDILEIEDTYDGLIPAFARFTSGLSRMQKRLNTQRSRIQKLLRLLADRKSLLQGILNYEAMEANRTLAIKAGISAENMEHLAVKTKLETVSMRIITVVTLFFLPGTFISTLMSTPIVTFPPGSPSTSDRNISTGALRFYVAVSVPLLLLTFAAWYAVYLWENRKEEKRQLKSKAFASSV